MAKLELELEDKQHLKILTKLLTETIESRKFTLKLKNGKTYFGYISYDEDDDTPFRDIWDDKKLEMLYGLDSIYGVEPKMTVNLSDIVGISFNPTEQREK